MLPATAGALDDDRPPTEHDEEQCQRDDECHDVARVDVHHFTPKRRTNAATWTTPRVVQKTAKLTRSAAGRVPARRAVARITSSQSMAPSAKIEKNAVQPR